MIDYNITKHETGVDKDYFDNHPNSHKLVYKMCDRCNKGSWVEFRNKTKICRSCSLSGRSLTEIHKQNISKGMNEK